MILRVLQFFFLFFLVEQSVCFAYVGLPLSRLEEKGITFSHKPGLHPGPIALTISNPTAIQLAFSLDGNLPTGNQVYSRSISLTQTTPIAIALIQNGKKTDTVYFGTYLIGFESKLPITTLIVPPADLFDPQRGIYIGGLSEGGARWGNCWGEAERQAFFELFDQGKPALNQGVGLRIFGGMTRQNAEKSMRVIARKKYGKGKFKYKVFPSKEIDEFNSLVLRTSGNDWLGTRFKDMMVASLAKDMQVDYLAYQPAVLFVNGTYWGIHNLREKINESYLEQNHGADPTKTNLIFGLGNGIDHGSNAGYQELFQFISGHSPSAPGFIDSVEKRMDVDNYFKYLCLQIHIRNVDSRGNVRYWQAKNLDNRFRWIYYDGDLGFGAVNANYLQERLSPTQTAWHNPTATTFLLRNLTANSELRERFVSQYCFLLSTWLQADTMAHRINYFKSWIEPEIERHLSRKNFSQTKGNWLSHVKQLINYSKARMPIAYQHLQSNFNLTQPYTLHIATTLPADHVQLTIERNPIPSLPYHGVFFKEARVAVGLSFLHPRYRFKGWENGPTERTWILSNPTDTLVHLRPKFEQTEQSTLNGNYWINSIGHGKKGQPKFIEINGWKTGVDSLHLIDSKGIWSTTLSPKQLPLVITEDSSAFRALFPKAHVSLIENKDIRMKRMGSTLYLMEPGGAWIDSVNLLGWDTTSRKQPFWVRGENGTLLISKDPPSFRMPKKQWYQQPAAVWAILAGTLLAIGLAIGYRKRVKKQAETALVILLLLATPTTFIHAQDKTGAPEKTRSINLEAIRKSPLVFQGPSQVESEVGFFRSFKPITQPLMWVAPFRPDALAKGDWFQNYTVQGFKEIPTEEHRHRHMQFNGFSVKNWIAGIRYDLFLFDTVKQLYLARIAHENGMESWYYPVVKPNPKADVRIPGTTLGLCGGIFYWQLRYRTCSILASAIIQSDGQPDPKGFVLENQCPPGSEPGTRFKNFTSTLGQKITEQIQNIDWEKALEQETKQ